MLGRNIECDGSASCRGHLCCLVLDTAICIVSEWQCFKQKIKIVVSCESIIGPSIKIKPGTILEEAISENIFLETEQFEEVYFGR